MGTLNNGNERWQDQLVRLKAEDPEAYYAELKEKREAREARKERLALKELMREKMEEKADLLTNKLIEALDVMVDDPTEMNAQTFAVIYDRVVGKETEKVDITSGGDKLPGITIVKKGGDSNGN